MKALSLGQATKEIHGKLVALVDVDSVNTLLGVAGYVASGKSRFSQKLQSDVTAILRKEAIHFPFDLWINKESVNPLTYAKRFLLDDFVRTVECICNGEQFFVPRYDIVKNLAYSERLVS